MTADLKCVFLRTQNGNDIYISVAVYLMTFQFSAHKKISKNGEMNRMLIDSEGK